MYYRTIGGCQNLDGYIMEDEVDVATSHHSNDKSPRSDSLTNRFFKKYVVEMRRPLTIVY